MMQRFFTFKALLGIALLLAFALLIPSLSCGLLITDYYHKLLLTGTSPVPPPHDLSLFGMFSFTSGNQERMQEIINLGVLPWWSALDVRVSFFRPLAELTHWLDYQLWPDSPLYMHIQNVLWYLADILIVGLFLQRIYRNKSAAIPGIAIVLFAVCGAHSVTVAWIACRNTLMATFFGVLMLYLHDRWREERKPQLQIMSLLALVTALLSAEYGMSSIPFLVAYALLLEKGSFKARLLSITPALVLTVLYLGFYVKSGFGSKNSELYISPSDVPAFLHAVITRIPEMLGAHFSGLSLGLLTQFPAYKPWVNGFFALMALTVIPVLFQSREARFLLLGVLGALVPVSSVVLSDRVLLFSSVGVMAIIAEALFYWRGKIAAADLGMGGKSVAFSALGLLVVMHFLLSPLQFIPLYEIPRQLQDEILIKPVASIQEIPQLQGKTVILVNPGMLLSTSYYMPIMLTDGKPVPKNILALSPGNAPVTVERVDERTLRITPEKGFLIGSDSWFPHPHKEAFTVGEQFRAADMTVTVESLDENKAPKSALFRFDQPLEDSHFLWLHYRTAKAIANGGTYSGWNLPRIGEQVVLKKFG